MDKEKKKRLDAALSAVNKKFGAGTVDTAAQMKKAGRLSKKVIPTASLELNESLWCGGFSGIVELFGPNSSGKTSLVIDTIVQAQQRDPNFVAGWLETEGSVTAEILEQHNVDMERLIFWKQEDVGNAENALDVARGIIASGEVDFLCVNSVAGLSPSTEIESDLEKQNIALVARIMSKFFRVANGLISKNNMVVVFINQVRDNVGQMFGDPATATGGKALGFYASQRIRMNQVKVEKSDPIEPEEGVKISCINRKNRFAGRNNPYTKCNYFATYANGIDPIIPIPQILQTKGIMITKGAWWYYLDGAGKPIVIDGIEGKFKSKAAFVEVLRTNESWKTAMITAAKSGPTIQTEQEIKDAEYENAQAEAFMSQMDDEVDASETAEETSPLDGLPI